MYSNDLRGYADPVSLFPKAVQKHKGIPAPLRFCVEAAAQPVYILNVPLYGLLPENDALSVCNLDTPAFSRLSGEDPGHMGSQAGALIPLGQPFDGILAYETAGYNFCKRRFNALPDGFGSTAAPSAASIASISSCSR